MKKVIPHLIYLLIIAFFIVYANIKASEADKHSIVAEENLVRAEHAQAMAEKQRSLAEQSAAEAMMAHNKAKMLSNQLEECKPNQK